MMTNDVKVKTISSRYAETFEKMIEDFYKEYADYNIECMYCPLVGSSPIYSALLIARRK